MMNNPIVISFDEFVHYCREDYKNGLLEENVLITFMVKVPYDNINRFLRMCSDLKCNFPANRYGV